MAPLDSLTHALEAVTGVFDAGGKTLVGFVTGILPTLVVLLTAIYTVIALVGEPRIRALARFLSKNSLTRYSLLPLLAMFFLTNPMAYTFGVFLEERHKPAFYDTTVSLCHPITGLFPHGNPSELFVWLGVATGITTLAQTHAVSFSLPKLALYYLGVALLINLLRGRVTEALTRRMMTRDGACPAPSGDPGAGAPVPHGTHAPAYHGVEVRRGPNGWGGPLVITPTGQRNKIVAVTGGDIPKVAQRLAELTGATVVDGFRSPPPGTEVAAVVIDCGGTARCGVYPRQRIPTINVRPVGASGPLAQFITEDIYVSGVQLDCLSRVDGPTASAEGRTTSLRACAAEPDRSRRVNRLGGLASTLTTVAGGMGGVVNILYSSGRKSIDTVITNVLPFIAFVAMLIGVINALAVTTGLAHWLAPLADNILGLVALSAICGLPFLSPVLGPGAVIAQVIGAAIVGPAIAHGTIAPHLALPALFAYDTQVGCDFAPVGLSLGEAKPETIRLGVPAVLLSRQIMGPVSVLVAWGASLTL
ncbi:PTS glucitol/sorbitol transporter subunit IIB [Pandoraea sputorum]|uniref:PTS sorbitol transporter subunit IIB n=1 Tax=Pandoraea sputorum TaxID=93222 RepID=A0A5E5BHD0_9BURK|nr:PTS glucitol/sorbitol transporter subunit IIC [Pandoraea sputorum]VVE84435.1 PTS sorbitol transporter subunit IIB [Pandoraea sputorum]